jgi:hypothetical protein
MTAEGGKGHITTEQAVGMSDLTHQGSVKIDGDLGRSMTFDVFKYTGKEGFDDYLYFTFA